MVYNAARVSLSERSRELASLRVLGFTRGDISLILLGELALLTLASLPCGILLGYGLSALIVQSIQSEVYRFGLQRLNVERLLGDDLLQATILVLERL